MKLIEVYRIPLNRSKTGENVASSVIFSSYRKRKEKNGLNLVIKIGAEVMQQSRWIVGDKVDPVFCQTEDGKRAIKIVRQSDGRTLSAAGGKSIKGTCKTCTIKMLLDKTGEELAAPFIEQRKFEPIVLPDGILVVLN